MKKKTYYNLVFLTITCLFSACDGDGSYNAKTYFENRSGHKVTIEPYGNKVLFKEGVRNLSINEVKIVDENILNRKSIIEEKKR